MDAGDWISVFMASIASASAAITYVVYRSATDPEVIVYADTDRKRPSIINLVIKNIGKGPAMDVTFHPSKPLPSKAFSIEVPNEMPAEMRDGPIVVGVPYLAPGQELILTWGQYGGLKKYLSTSNIEVITKYKRTKSLRPFSASIGSVSKLDISQFEGTDASDHNWGPKLVKAIEKSNKELIEIKQAITEVTAIESS